MHQTKKCKKNLHWMTEANTDRREGRNRCIACRETTRNAYLRKLHPKIKPNITGVCTKGLHKWVPENWQVSESGVVRCRPCRYISQFKGYRQNGRMQCIVKGCRRATVRQSKDPYICPRHRRNPPTWIAKLGFKIVGTSVHEVL